MSDQKFLHRKNPGLDSFTGEFSISLFAEKIIPILHKLF